MRPLSLVLAALAFAGCAPAQTTRTTYVHEVVVVETPRVLAKRATHPHNRHGWALGHRDAEPRPRVTRSVSVVSVEQQVLIEAAPRQTDNNTPRTSAYFATQDDTRRPAKRREREKPMSADEEGKSKDKQADAPRRSKRTKERAGRDSKDDKARNERDRDATSDKAPTERDRDAKRHEPKRRERDAKQTKLKKDDSQRGADKERSEAKRDRKREAKKPEKERKREALAERKDRQRKAKAKAKQRRSAQKSSNERERPSFEALARR